MYSMCCALCYVLCVLCCVMYVLCVMWYVGVMCDALCYVCVMCDALCMYSVWYGRPMLPTAQSKCQWQTGCSVMCGVMYVFCVLHIKHCVEYCLQCWSV